MLSKRSLGSRTALLSAQPAVTAWRSPGSSCEHWRGPSCEHTQCMQWPSPSLGAPGRERFARLGLSSSRGTELVSHLNPWLLPEPPLQGACGSGISSCPACVISELMHQTPSYFPQEITHRCSPLMHASWAHDGRNSICGGRGLHCRPIWGVVPVLVEGESEPTQMQSGSQMATPII